MITGGKFANGAITAAFARAHNHEGGDEKKGAPISDDEWDLLRKGDYIGFWKSRYAKGDPVARIALIGWGYGDDVGASWLERGLAAWTWSDLEDYIKEHGIDVTKEQIALELAKAHAKMVQMDKQGVLHLLDPYQVTHYHWEVFKKYNIPHYIFGGSVRVNPFSDDSPVHPTDLLAFLWCSGCDEDPYEWW